MLSGLKIGLLSAAAGALIASGAAYKVHGWRVDSLKRTWEQEKATAVGDARTEEIDKCNAAAKVTQERSHELETNLNDTRTRYNRLLKYGTERACSGQPPRNTAGGDEAPSADMSFVQVPTVDGLDAGLANDEQAAALIGCQNTIADIYKLNGQAHKLPPEYR